jgi:predicted nuclease of predicted toxin-antitoxin system
MKLLFDQNLSFKLCRQLADLFPESSHVRLLGLDRAEDRALWEFARDNDYTLVPLDADLADLAVLLGLPPRLIWSRCGNQRTGVIENLLRAHAETIAAFESGPAACLEIY